MILTAIGKGNGAGPLYPEFVGRRGLFVGSGSGPSSYSSTTGDVISLALPNYYIDAVCGMTFSVSGNYYVVPKPSGTGTRQTWTLYWYQAGGWTAASGDLSAEKVQLALFVGQF